MSILLYKQYQNKEAGVEENLAHIETVIKNHRRVTEGQNQMTYSFLTCGENFNYAKTYLTNLRSSIEITACRTEFLDL